MATSRTLKYFEALLSGVWVLSPEWLLRSAAAGSWLPEGEFELAGDTSGLGGPAAGRRHGSQLFAGLRMHFPAPGAEPKRSSSAPSVIGRTSSRLLQQQLEDDGGQPSPEELSRLASRGGAEVISTALPLPDAVIDPPFLGTDARRAGYLSPSMAAGRETVSSSPWWRRPIAVVPGGADKYGNSTARSTSGGETSNLLEAGWLLLPSAWMLDCISRGELLAPPVISHACSRDTNLGVGTRHSVHAAASCNAAVQSFVVG